MRVLPLLRLAALAALIVSAAQAAFPQQRQRQPSSQLVESVEVAGVRRLTREEIFRHIKTRPGEPYDPEQVQRDLQALAGLGVFDRRSLRVVTEVGPRGGVEVSFEVMELPVIESVEFQGVPADDERLLRRTLRRRSFAVHGGGVYDRDKVGRAAEAVKELLRGRGWRDVEVQLRVEQNAAGSIKIVFAVRGQPSMNRPPKRLDRPGRRDAVAANLVGVETRPADVALKLD